MQEKEQKISPIKERILQFVDTLGISKRDFYKIIDVSRGTLESKTGITEDILAKFIAKYPQVNIDWLMTGTGVMLTKQDEHKTESDVLEKNEQKPYYENINYKPRPYIDAFYGALGVPNGFILAVKADECEQISIPFISNYDFSIKGRGDSMINRKNPDRSICDGDLIACRIWTSRSYIQWGQVYALATSQGVVIKQIQESEKEGYIKCVSFNEEDGYTPYDIPVEEIYDWALVVSVTHTAKW